MKDSQLEYGEWRYREADRGRSMQRAAQVRCVADGRRVPEPGIDGGVAPYLQVTAAFGWRP